jgi:hypothetical protein
MGKLQPLSDRILIQVGLGSLFVLKNSCHCYYVPLKFFGMLIKANKMTHAHTVALCMQRQKQKAKAAEKSAGGVLLSSETSEKPTFGVVSFG